MGGPVKDGAQTLGRGEGSGYGRPNPCGNKPCPRAGGQSLGAARGPGKAAGPAGIWVTGSVNSSLAGEARPAGSSCLLAAPAKPALLGDAARSLNPARHIARRERVPGPPRWLISAELPLRHK